LIGQTAFEFLFRTLPRAILMRFHGRVPGRTVDFPAKNFLGQLSWETERLIQIERGLAGYFRAAPISRRTRSTSRSPF
jgi:hypothetical protein